MVSSLAGSRRLVARRRGDHVFPFLPHIEALTSTTPGDAEAAQEYRAGIGVDHFPADGAAYLAALTDIARRFV